MPAAAEQRSSLRQSKSAHSTDEETLEFPKLVVFDLDFTLWPLWIDTHIRPPLRPSPKLNTVLDRHNGTISFYPDVPPILHNLRKSNILVAAASRTGTPGLARKALGLLKLPPSGESARSFFDHLTIYPGSKIRHFRELHATTGLDYSEMLFFDDEARNQEVEDLGVTFVLIGSDGVTHQNFDEGIEEWRRRRQRE